MRGDVPPIGKRVDPRLLGREAKQRAQVVDVRVHPAVGDEPQQMDALAALEGCEERAVLEERPVLDRLGDPGEVLVQPPARADRQVPHLGVPHLARRATRRLPRRPRALCAGTPRRAGRTRACPRELTAFPGPAGAQPQPSRMTSATSGRLTRPRKCSRKTRPREMPRRRGAPSTSGCAQKLCGILGLYRTAVEHGHVRASTSRTRALPARSRAWPSSPCRSPRPARRQQRGCRGLEHGHLAP